MRGVAILAVTMLAATTTQAAPKRTPFQPMTLDEINTAVEMGEELETYVQGDLNGDNDVDTVFIISSDYIRTLYVALASRKLVPLRHVPAGNFKLQIRPVRQAGMSIVKGVLTIEDSVDGMHSIYRFRGDTKKPRMRLIGMDASLFPQGGEDGRSMSWNLLTGAAETSLLRETRTGYDALHRTKFKRKSPPVYMEQTPDPELELIGMTTPK